MENSLHQNTNFCTQCGTKLNSNAKFCTGCGAPLENIAPPPVDVIINPSMNENIALDNLMQKAHDDFALAQNHLDGIGVPRNYIQAMHLFGEAASLGHAEASEWIGICRLYQAIDIFRKNSLERLNAKPINNCIPQGNVRLDANNQVFMQSTNHEAFGANSNLNHNTQHSKETSQVRDDTTQSDIASSIGKFAVGAVAGAVVSNALHGSQTGLAHEAASAASQLATTEFNRDDPFGVVPPVTDPANPISMSATETHPDIAVGVNNAIHSAMDINESNSEDNDSFLNLSGDDLF